MPDQQPSSAPQADAPRQTDDLTAAAVLHDPAPDAPAGGGARGMGVGEETTGAATPNSPVDAPTPHEGGDALAAAEARRQAADPPEPGHGSQ